MCNLSSVANQRKLPQVLWNMICQQMIKLLIIMKTFVEAKLLHNIHFFSIIIISGVTRWNRFKSLLILCWWCCLHNLINSYISLKNHSFSVVETFLIFIQESLKIPDTKICVSLRKKGWNHKQNSVHLQN